MASTDMKENSFKLPGSSLDEVFKALQGYASTGKSASLSDISKSTGMHTTVISKNVGFLLCLGLIEGGKNKAATQLGTKLGLALMHNVQEEVETILSDIVADNEFLKNVLAAVRIRKGMDASSLRSHIAYSAGLSKTGSTTTGTGAVVELLKRSAHLREEEGKLVVGAPVVRPPSEPSHEEKAVTPQAVVRTVERVSDNTPTISIAISIQVNCEPNDLENLGEKLRKIVDDFSSGKVESSNEE